MPAAATARVVTGSATTVRAEPPPRVPGGLMLHPAMVLAVVVLAVNDHWLKARFGPEPAVGVVTGKLSDLAGLAFFPALLVSAVEVARWALRRDRGGWAFGPHELVAAMAVAAIGFAAVQSIPAAAGAYEAGLAAVRWCPAGVAAALRGGPWPPLPDVGHVMDVSDTVCLPAVWASRWAAGRTGWRTDGAATATREGGAVDI